MQENINTTTRSIVYYENELEDEFSEAKIDAKHIGADYEYDGGLMRKIGRGLFYYVIARPFGLIFLKLKYSHKVVGREKFKEAKDTGFFLYGNHTNPMADAFMPAIWVRPKSAYVIVHPANVSIPVLGKITPSLGAIPLPDDMHALKTFEKKIEKEAKKDRVVAIYPEAHIWPFCTFIRNFKEPAFRYPIKYDKPVFCFTDTYHKGKGGKVKMITYIEGPFYADKSLPMKDQKKDLRDRVFAAMSENAKKNTLELVKYVKRDVDDTKGEET